MRRQRIVAVALVSLLWSASAASAAMLTVDSVTVQQNDVFTVSVRGVDIVDLFTFGFDLTYDSTKLQAKSIVQGSFFDQTPDTFFLPPPDLATPPVVGPVGGTIVNQGVNCAPCELAVITFLASGTMTGEAALGFQNVTFFNSSDPPDNLIEIAASGGRVTVLPTTTPVPEPATVGLLGLGLLGVARRFV